MREHLRAFETRRMPFEIQVGQTTLLLQREPDRLLREIGNRVRLDPDPAEQGAFTLLVESSDRYASPAARKSLAGAVQYRKGSGGTREADANWSGYNRRSTTWSDP